jgi:TRAP-type C4-dicarboxylate transport system substrate-binding protein
VQRTSHQSSHPFDRRASTTAVAATLCCLAGLASCQRSSSPSEATAPAATSAAAPVTTTAAVVTSPVMFTIGVTPGWDQTIDPLIEAVDAGSAGSLRLAVDPDWQDTHADSDIEQTIIKAVASGELPLGYVGTRAFSALGDTSLDALTAPFLVDSYDLQQAVLDSDIPGRMLASVDSLGVRGLAVGSGPLRYPLGVDGPLMSPADFAGISFHTFRTASNAATAAALGATPTDVWGDLRDAAIDDGTIDATENSLHWVLNNGRTSYITLNAPLWPGTGVLIANPDALASLSSDQMEALRQAAAEALPTTAWFAADDAANVGVLCDAGKRFASATTENLAALRQAVQPVYDQLAGDATTAELLTEIEALKATLTPHPIVIPPGCAGKAAAVETPVAEGTDDPSVLDGSFRFEWTVDELIAIGATPHDAQINSGGFVLTFANGQFDQTLDNVPADHCRGTYGISGNRITMVASSHLADWDCGGDSLGALLLDAAWRLDGNQLTFSDFVHDPESGVMSWNAVYLTKPLTKIG